MLDYLLRLLIAAAIFTVLERRWRERDWFRANRKNVTVNLFYWFVNYWLGVATLALLFRALPKNHTPLTGWMAGLPWVGQLLIVFVVLDFSLYWVHRALHSNLFWPIHAIHHSSNPVYWMSSFRFHPVEAAGSLLFQYLLSYALGFPLTQVLNFNLALSINALLVHAEIDWTYGPLGRILVGPRYHRIHHIAGDQKTKFANYSNLFSFWDLFFGTFSKPSEPVKQKLGLEEPVDERYLSQILFPMRRPR